MAKTMKTPRGEARRLRRLGVDTGHVAPRDAPDKLPPDTTLERLLREAARGGKGQS